MEHSKYFNKVKNYYQVGSWDMNRVANAVISSEKTYQGWITAEEYEEIVGETYIKHSVENDNIE